MLSKHLCFRASAAALGGGGGGGEGGGGGGRVLLGDDFCDWNVLVWGY